MSWVFFSYGGVKILSFDLWQRRFWFKFCCLPVPCVVVTKVTIVQGVEIIYQPASCRGAIKCSAVESRWYLISCHRPCHQNIAIVCESDVARFSLTCRGFVTSTYGRSQSANAEPGTPPETPQSANWTWWRQWRSPSTTGCFNIELEPEKECNITCSLFPCCYNLPNRGCPKIWASATQFAPQPTTIVNPGNADQPKNMSVSLFAQSWPCQVLIYWRYLSYIRPVF